MPLLLLFLGLVALLPACGKGRETGYRYPEEEVALLKIAAENILTFENRKHYDTLYQEQASRDFKRRVSRQSFLRLVHCVETHLGSYEGYDHKTLKFVRKREGKRDVDLLNVTVYRTMGPMTERFVFVREGLGFRVQSFRWLSTREEFLDCLSGIRRPDGP